MDWKHWSKVYPFKGVNDPEYIKAKEETFSKNGHGWWWDWTKVNTPLPGVYSAKDSKRCGGHRGPKRVIEMPKEDFNDPKNK
tara:strand:+ start:699 stop:944 length:246 start_codon:yes stop_codon:yes gene_type:complete